MAAVTVRKMRAEEAVWCEKAREIWTCSREDTALLVGSGASSAGCVTIPNGVDIETFSPPTESRSSRTFVFFGRLDYFPNSDAIEYLTKEILPLIPASVPFEVRIVGAGNLTKVRALAERDTRLTVVGRTEDIRQEIGRAIASLVPLRAGGGTRLKLLESLAVETPAISTSVGAEGLLPEIGPGIWLADTPAAFAEQMMRVLDETPDARTRGAAGRAAVAANFDWSQLVIGMQGRLSAILRS
jgi:glycosyltransferase involved in cell wall biosynthesis